MNKPIIKIVIFIFFLSLMTIICNKVFMPKWLWTDGDGETNRYDSFYSLETNDLQYITIGPSTSFCSVNPMQIYAESGIRGYDLGGSLQDLSVSYYWLKEACKTQSPQYLFLSVTGLFYETERMGDSQKLMQIGSMKFSGNKLEAIKICSQNNTLRKGLLFPMYQYHDRWDSLTDNDFKCAFTNQYYFMKGARLNDGNSLNHDGQLDNRIEVVHHSDQTEVYKPIISERNKKYFDDIYRLCRENNILLIPIHYPSLLNWTDEYKKSTNDFLSKYNLSVLDLDIEVNNLDWHQDTNDNGYHLNYYGAAKTSAYLTRWLQQRISGNTDTECLWENDLNEYRNYEENKLLSDREKALNILSSIEKNKEEKLIIISVCDTACSGWNDLLTNKINDLNLIGDFYNNTQNSFVGIIDKGRNVFEKWSEYTVIYDGEFSNHTDEVKNLYVKSGGLLSGNATQIIIDGTDYSVNSRGLNIVVYDYVNDQVTLSIAIDTHESGWKITTKIDNGSLCPQILKDGAYRFLSSIDHKYSCEFSETNGWALNTDSDDAFKLEYIGNGLYYIKKIDEMEYLTVRNWGNTNGTEFCFEPFTGLSEQKWYISEYTDGTYSLHSLYNKMCIEVPQGEVYNRASLWLYEANDTYAQRFILQMVD